MIQLPPSYAYLGIDPGLHGAIAVITITPGAPTTAVCYDMPLYKVEVNGGKRNRLNLGSLNCLFKEIAPTAAHAIIEEVHAMPAQGVASSFTFGFVCGVIQALCAAHQIPVTLVSPRQWKKRFNLSDSKDEARLKASQLFPGSSAQWANTANDGRAEAALLAFYGQLERLTL